MEIKFITTRKNPIVNLLKCITLSISLSSVFSVALAQHKKDYKVAIFLYPEADILDFAGPASTFAVTPNFHVYTVSIEGQEIISQDLVNARPQYSVNNAPEPDIVVFPGSNMRVNFKDQRVFDWINTLKAKNTILMSVCKGAGILAKAGLFDNLTVTTFSGFSTGLQTMVPSAKVVSNTKYVDDGEVIAAGGVTAGINTALHIIAKIKGNDLAKTVANIMDFRDWKPGEVLDYSRNSYIEANKDPNNQPKKENANSPAIPIDQRVPDEGEMKNLASVLIANGSYQKAAQVLEQKIKWYPYSLSSYALLRQAYVNIGKPVPVDHDSFIDLAKSGKPDEVISVYNSNRKVFPGWPLFTEQAMNSAGYQLMQKNDFSGAIKIFAPNTLAFPES
jgi:putative intracellular protease/amidase